MKKQIIIFSDMYYPHPMAGGICAHEIALGLLSLDYKVHVICHRRKKEKRYELFQGIHVHRISSTWITRLREFSSERNNFYLGIILYHLAMLLSKVCKLICLRWFPLASPFLAARYYRRALQIMKKEGACQVLAIYYPIEAQLAALWLKKNKSIDFIIYSLDSISNSDGTKYMPIEWVNHKGWQWEKRIYQNAAGIINLRCHKQHYSNRKYDQFRDKMRISDIPLLRKSIGSTDVEPHILTSTDINWIYAGTLEPLMRKPDFVCDFFLGLSQSPSRKLHFFSKGNCEPLLKKYESKSGGSIIRHGHIPLDVLQSIFRQADFLISIGNNHSNFIPSKTFEYIATGKPIIHFYTQEKDVCLAYLKRYPLALCIKQDYETLDESRSRYLEFEENVLHLFVNFEFLEKEYVENTPVFTANLIDHLFYKDE